MRFSLIARQGQILLSIWLATAVVLAITELWPYSLLLLFLSLLTAYLYRDLPRAVPPRPLAIVSPLDGRILACGADYDPYADREAMRIEAVSHWSGPYVLRSPIEGRVHRQWLSPRGRSDDGRVRPAEMAIWVRTDEADDVVLVVSPRYRWLPISCRIQVGERVGQGRRCGFIPLGVRIEVFLPDSTRVQVVPGQPVTGGDSVLGELVHR